MKRTLKKRTLKSLKTSIEVQQMTCKYFLNKFLPAKVVSLQYTRAGLFFMERIAGMVSGKNWEDEQMQGIIHILQDNPPTEILKHRNVGPVKLQTLIEAFQRADINLDDIPEYRDWLQENKVPA